MNAAPCIAPEGRECLLRHLYAVRHGGACRKCEPAAQVVELLRTPDEDRAETPLDPAWKSLLHTASAPPAETSDSRRTLDLSTNHMPKAQASGPLDLAALRVVLRDLMRRQAKTGQKSVFLERLQASYNAKARKGLRFKGKMRFREALAGVPGLDVRGGYLRLDEGVWAFCANWEGR